MTVSRSSLEARHSASATTTERWCAGLSFIAGLTIIATMTLMGQDNPRDFPDFSGLSPRDLTAITSCVAIQSIGLLWCVREPSKVAFGVCATPLLVALFAPSALFIVSAIAVIIAVFGCVYRSTSAITAQ